MGRWSSICQSNGKSWNNRHPQTTPDTDDSDTDDIKGIILKQNGDVQIGDDEDHTLQNAVVLVDWEPYNEPSSIAHYGEDDVHVRVVSQPFWNANQQNLLANGWYCLAPPTPLAQPTPQTTTTKKDPGEYNYATSIQTDDTGTYKLIETYGGG